MYQSRIDRKIGSQSLGWENKGIEERWEKLKSVIQDTAEETIGRKRRVKKPWFNKICEEAIQRRKITKNNWLNDTDNREKLTQYRTRQREASNILRCEKRKHVQNLIREADHDYANHKTRNLYKKINALSKNYKRTEKFLRNEDGTLITTDDELSDKWVRYFS